MGKAVCDSCLGLSMVILLFLGAVIMLSSIFLLPIGYSSGCQACVISGFVCLGVATLVLIISSIYLCHFDCGV